MIALAEVIKKEEEFVVDNRPTDSEPKLMNLLDSLVRYEGVATRYGQRPVALEHRMKRIKCRVLSIVVTRPVEFICARLRCRVDDSTGGASDLGRRDTGRHFEFRNRVRIWENANRTELRFVVINTVEGKVIVR